MSHKRIRSSETWTKEDYEVLSSCLTQKMSPKHIQENYFPQRTPGAVNSAIQRTKKQLDVEVVPSKPLNKSTSAVQDIPLQSSGLKGVFLFYNEFSNYLYLFYVIIVQDLISRLQSNTPLSSPPSTTTTSATKDTIEDEDEDDTYITPKKSKGEKIITRVDVNHLVSWFLRPERHRAFVILRTFPGMKLDFNVVSSSKLEIKIEMGFREDAYDQIAIQTNLSIDLIKHDLPIQHSIVVIDVQHTILNVTEVSFKQDPIKVIELELLNDGGKRGNLRIKM